VVTGAASGIGRACAARLRTAGILVAGLDLHECDGVDAAFEVDVADAAAVDEALDATERALGPVAYVVTAAGYYEQRPLGSIGAGAWRRMLGVLLDGTANVARGAFARMRTRGAGEICTIGSELALCGDGNAAHYAAAKGAVHAFTKSLALEAAPEGVRVNCVAPGPTDTPLMTEELRDPAYLSSLVLGRLVEPEEVAATVSFVLLGRHNLIGQVVSPNAGAVV
jgi:2-hydroxycyclohexanecarboxyl-CoA dehydrogenase